MANYISFRNDIVTQFIQTRPITDLCMAAEKIPGSRFTKRWQEQVGLDLEGQCMSAWEAEQEEGE